MMMINEDFDINSLISYRNVTWENATNRAEFSWTSALLLRDEDSSLVAGIDGVSAMDGALIMPYAPHLPTEKCGPAATNAGDLGNTFGQGTVPGVRCLPEVTAIRYSVSDIVPMDAIGRNMSVTLVGGGTQDVLQKAGGLNGQSGWVTNLVNNYTFQVGWRDLSPFTNLSYSANFENLRVRH